MEPAPTVMTEPAASDRTAAELFVSTPPPDGAYTRAVLVTAASSVRVPSAAERSTPPDSANGDAPPCQLPAVVQRPSPAAPVQTWLPTTSVPSPSTRSAVADV